MWTTSWAAAATDASWVTMTIVWPARGGVAEQLDHALRCDAVERPGRLVRQHHVGPGDERPRDRRPLLFAAGQLARPGVDRICQTQPIEQLRRLGPGTPTRHAVQAGAAG